MIGQQHFMHQNITTYKENNSPTKTDCTYDSSTDIAPFYIHMPFFVFYPVTNNFMQFQLSSQQMQVENRQSHCESLKTDSQNQQIKIQCEEQIIFNNKNQCLREQMSTTQQPRNYNQNENRNVMPNLIRLLLNFVLLKDKSEKYLKQIIPDLTEQQINKYYNYTRKLKTKGYLGNNSYISEKKLKEILGITDSQYFGNRSIRQRKQNEVLNKKIMRILSMFYLNNLMVQVIICSTKMKKQMRNIHLSKRNRLISILRHGQINDHINKIIN